MYRAASSLVSTSFVVLIMFAVIRSATCLKSSYIFLYFKVEAFNGCVIVQPYLCLCSQCLGLSLHPRLITSAKIVRDLKGIRITDKKPSNPKGFQNLAKTFPKKALIFPKKKGQALIACPILLKQLINFPTISWWCMY